MASASLWYVSTIFLDLVRVIFKNINYLGCIYNTNRKIYQVGASKAEVVVSAEEKMIFSTQKGQFNDCRQQPWKCGTMYTTVDYATQRLRRSGDNLILILDNCRDESSCSRGELGIGNEKHQGVITFYSCNPNQHSWEIEELEDGKFKKIL